jgi:hypothetical protein
MMIGHRDLEVLYYYGQCQILIHRALSRSQPFYDGNGLATIVCMLMYDGFGDKLGGVFYPKSIDNRLLDPIPTFAHSGGLAEAAARHALQQDVHM